MLKCMYSGVSGLSTHQTKMDVVGNNIANVNTYGFKASTVNFTESIYQSKATSSAGNEVIGGTNAAQVGYGTNVGTINMQMVNGTYVPTTSTTDIMIDGNGFFLVGPKPQAGDAANDEVLWGATVDSDDADAVFAAESLIGGLNLTRVGDFTVDSDGYLVDGNGNVVYGSVPSTFDDAAAGILGEDLVPIRILPSTGDMDDYPEAGELNADAINPLTISSLAIDSSGRLIANAEDGTILTLGQVAIAVVQNPNGLSKTASGYYSIGGNAGKVFPYTAGSGTSGLIVNSGLESSNVDLSVEFSNMITTQRGFQACSKMITVADEMLQELVNLKR